MWLEIGKTVFEIFSKQKELERERKDRISDIFQAVSDLLQETSKELSLGQYPHGKCAAMESLSADLIKEIAKAEIVDSVKLEELEKMLIESSKLEREFASRENPETLINLSITAGKFQALSLFLKI